MTWVSTLRAHEATFRRAPSAHNTQPWTLDYRSDEIRIGVDPQRALPHSDPTRRDLALGLGAFIETVLIVATDLGLAVEASHDGRLVSAASIYPTPFTAADISARRVARGRYAPGSLDPAILAALEPGLVAVPARSLVADLVAADRWMFGTPAVTLELRDWLRLSPNHPRYAEDGLTDRALELAKTEAMSLRGALRAYSVTRRLGLARLLAASGKSLLRSDGTVLIMTSEPATVRPTDVAPATIGPAGVAPAIVRPTGVGSFAGCAERTVADGRRLMRTWLGLARHGLSVHPLSQLIDCPTTAARIAERIGAPPIAIFRVGRPVSAPIRSARLPVAGQPHGLPARGSSGRSNARPASFTEEYGPAILPKGPPMTEFSPESLAAINPAEFAQLVKATPDSTIAEVMASDSRGKILDGVFDRMPTLFRADRAGATQAVIHWNITGGPGGSTDTYETVIEDGACTVTNQPAREPKLAMTLDPVTFFKVISGSGNPLMMFMTGKIKAKGDLGLAAQVAKLFDLPKA
jgi:putative sterol carrier protein